MTGEYSQHRLNPMQSDRMMKAMEHIIQKWKRTEVADDNELFVRMEWPNANSIIRIAVNPSPLPLSYPMTRIPLTNDQSPPQPHIYHSKVPVELKGLALGKRSNSYSSHIHFQAGFSINGNGFHITFDTSKNVTVQTNIDFTEFQPMKIILIIVVNRTYSQ